MEELRMKFGWRKRLKILFGGTVNLFIDRKIIGTFIDKNGDAFVELREKPKKKSKGMDCLFD